MDAIHASKDEGINVDVDLDLDKLLDDRIQNRDVKQRAIIPSGISVVNRGLIYDSRISLASTNGVFSVPDQTTLTLTTTTTSNNTLAWIAQYDVSFFVGQVSASNEWPSGSFFSTAAGTPATQLAKNYVYTQFTSALQSTAGKQVNKSRFFNNTGITQNIGILVYFRYILNGSSS